jgi:mono/diheme cytochrome c family protein
MILRAPAAAMVAAGVGLAAALAGLSGSRANAQTGPVTFTEHVAPIIFDNCATCHRPGEAGPFSLLSYDDVRRRGRLIASVARSRVMPPWKAGPGDVPFANERRLSDGQIATLERWVAAGMPEGDPSRLPPLPRFAEGWQLGPPDLVVRMREPFAVPADGPDIYRNFVVPLNLAEDRWVRAVDFRPSARSVVHHSLFFLDDTGAARLRDERDPGPGFGGAMGGGVGLGQQSLTAPFGRGGRGRGADQGPGADRAGVRAGLTLGGWAVGGRARELPDGLAFFVPKGSDLVLSTHFHPSGKPEQEISTVGLYFADAPPTRAFAGVQLPPLFGALEGLDIPPGQADYVVSDSFVLPVDVEAFSVGGHAHYLGREMKMTAALPDGRTRTLLWIPDWDFAWQEAYRFEEFVRLPKGTRLDVTIRYDNSDGNPRNPSRPPRRVTWGEQSTDEMGSLTLQVVAADERDWPALRDAYAEHVRRAAFTREGLGSLLRRAQERRGGGGGDRR